MQHLLHVQGADEDEREEAAAQQQPRHVRTGERPQPEDRQRQQRILDPALDHQERDQQRDGRRQQRDRPRGAPAVLRCLRDRVHEQHESAGAGDRAGSVEPPTRCGEPAVGHDPRREQQRGRADRDVQVEDVLPPGVPGESPPAISPTVAPPAPSPPQIPSALLRSAPSANMFITIDRAAGSMIAAPSPCTARLAIRTARCRERAPQRAAVNSAEPEHQDPAAAEQVGRPAAEEQEPAERERVRGHDPLQVGLLRSADRGRSSAARR